MMSQNTWSYLETIKDKLGGEDALKATTDEIYDNLYVNDHHSYCALVLLTADLWKGGADNTHLKDAIGVSSSIRNEEYQALYDRTRQDK
jgi:hypothetical protein